MKPVCRVNPILLLLEKHSPKAASRYLFSTTIPIEHAPISSRGGIGAFFSVLDPPDLHRLKRARKPPWLVYEPFAHRYPVESRSRGTDATFGTAVVNLEDWRCESGGSFCDQEVLIKVDFDDAGNVISVEMV